MSPAHIYKVFPGIIRLIRPLNFVMFWIGVAVGAILVAGLEVFQEELLGRTLLAMGSAACIGGAANAINDYFDIEIDRINRPDRPLPSGLISKHTALVLWGLLSVLGIGLSFLLSFNHVVLALGSVILLYIYSATLKRQGLIGNLVVSLIVGMALIYGGMAVGSPSAAGIGAVFAFVTTLVREWIKDLADMTGDNQAGARTLPITLGSRSTIRLIVGWISVIIVTAPMPFLFWGYKGLFLFGVCIVNGILLATIWVLVQSQNPVADAPKASSLMKAAMFMGLVALTVA
jgi:geranylgeranylglycerol-phosphate geranylgeranyltransferase